MIYGRQVNYRLAYAIGFKPWEAMAEHPPFAEKLIEIVGREEEPNGPPHGRALDVGTGSAVWAVLLAERGWDVTGIDLVEKALGRGEKRAAEAGVHLTLRSADVTAIPDDVGSGFRLVLDTGTFHGLSDTERQRMGAQINRIAAPDSTVILDCFEPRRRGPLPRGASRADVQNAFPGWEIVDAEVADTDPDLIARLFRFDERFYRLRRA
jgi:SAM-dependent methyltransferase